MSLKPISEIGEFGLIEKISSLCKKTIPEKSSIVEGIGDDCAVVELDTSRLQVSTTDLLVEGVHFDLLTTPLHHLGSKSLSVNVSDICAMNAKPSYALVSIALPPSASVDMVEQLYQGMTHAAGLYGTALVGGDTSASSTGLVISVTVVGETSKERITMRSGAKPGDMICVTGALGGAAAGLNVLMREKQIMMEHLQSGEEYDRNMMNDLKEYSGAIQNQLLPSARTDIIDYFERNSIVPGAMIDLSDGLASDLHHLCRRSQAGARIEEGRIPVLSEARHIADEFQQDALDYAISGGEDYQLLFTISGEQFSAIAEHPDISVIGSITPEEDGIVLSDIYGMNITLKEPGGFDHFRK
ncbi:thiamine-phosphate kinase [Prosthecochloris sp. N3]|uniref:Thiamine-monophosphate kinase n=1 Tax=Prosthecochloris ethylica TaxID=2743976 RepID=A0ABR9XRS2_9CHLB|nr:MULTISPECIES: thiamine-phosphate kinase [Prosthecochloris]MEC9487799.1 thiamine-phosphate kinase [Prosthecochloris sp.]MBF0586905.1 thiamine-phosphate kinase [Prosthecochloris ethylica]MBF0636747.1 thiamine-phosphate kinase [Prosthecochloris ethylica]NUK48424.1 thiamine-phosphate kinase [Prosthecochloris ethylica]RNA64262.1 thiamine-phosphate kinase [Prosthecochloris sp. ZM_2]